MIKVANESLKISLARTGSVDVVEVVGEIDIGTAPYLDDALKVLLEQSVVVVDLTKVRYIDSSGLTVLVREDRRRDKDAQRLLVVLPASKAAAVFFMTRLDTVLRCFHELAPALQAAAAPP